MPTTVTATNGNTYHLWQLGDMTAPEPSDSHEFSMLENEMSEGYRSTELFGLNTGIRSWTLPMPTLADSSVIAAAVTDPYAATVSRVDYVRNLYKYNRTTGTPFAYQDPNSGQYYLVDMVNPELSMTKLGKGVDIYSSTITLRQRRLNGVTIFSVGDIETVDTTSPILWLKGSTYVDGTEDWPPSSSGGYVVSGTGGVDKIAANVNGHDIVRLNGSTGYVGDAGATLALKELFIVMKMQVSSFANNSGILTSATGGGVQVLLGSSGTTKFANPSLTASLYTYRKNGTTYEQSDLQAPMNAWGIVHLRYETGWSVTGGFQFGKDRATAGTFAQMDIAEIICFTSLTSIMSARELTEHLAVKYAITLD